LSFLNVRHAEELACQDHGGYSPRVGDVSEGTGVEDGQVRLLAYLDICASGHDAPPHDLPTASPVTLNRCLDDAIAGAVTEYSREREATRDGEAAHGGDRLEFLAHELRNLANTAIVAFEVLKTGSVGAAGATGTVLHRSLMGICALIGRSLAELRRTHGVQNLEHILVSEFIEELAPAATLEARAKGITLTVIPVDEEVVIEGDRQVLAAVVTNVLQNAFTFTRPRTTVTLRVGASAERVLIEIHDECGVLPREDVTDLFRPLEQRSADQTGLGLGLAFSRWAVETNHGRIYARNVPDKGCVFTVDLPRLAVRVPSDVGSHLGPRVSRPD
jgi:signal transduction histidine kinase